MALDGAFLHTIRREIEHRALDARVEKISQPSRDTLILTLRGRAGSHRLLLSSNSSCPRIHFVENAPENPATPPMFCMLLRKHLGGGRLVGVRQPGLERLLWLDFQTTNELGDLTTLTLAVEIMGRHSNIIAVGQDARILDAVKRVGQELSQLRQVLPGMAYTPPPPQHKQNPLTAGNQELLGLLAAQPEQELSKALLGCLEGLSPLLCRELAHKAGGGQALTNQALRTSQQLALSIALDELRLNLTQQCHPVALSEESGKLLDFSFLPITQYGSAAQSRSFESPSQLLEYYYHEKDAGERLRQRAGDLLRLLQSTTERTARRLQSQQAELEQSQGRERLRQFGDLLSSNLHLLQKGQTKALVEDYFHPEGRPVEIVLDPQLTPAQNAQKYYSDYRKAETACRVLAERIQAGQEELEYLESVADALSRSTTEAALNEIRQELASQGYLRTVRRATGRQAGLPPLRYLSRDGFSILCGRNNLQNDRLTLRESHSGDIWLHTQKIPGSHVIIQCQGRPVPDATLEQAAIIAATNSRAGHSRKVAVDYTAVKYVKKPKGAKPGMVIYTDFRTAIVDPDAHTVAGWEHKG